MNLASVSNELVALTNSNPLCLDSKSLSIISPNSDTCSLVESEEMLFHSYDTENPLNIHKHGSHEHDSFEYSIRQKSLGEIGGEGLYSLATSSQDTLLSSFQKVNKVARSFWEGVKSLSNTAKTVCSLITNFLPTFSLPCAEATSLTNTNPVEEICTYPNQPFSHILDPSNYFEGFHLTNVSSDSSCDSWLQIAKIFRAQFSNTWIKNPTGEASGTVFRLALQKERNIAVLASYQNIYTMDLNGLPSVVKLGTVSPTFYSNAHRLSVDGNDVAISDKAIARIFDIQNPGLFIEKANYTLPSDITAIKQKDGLTHIRNSDSYSIVNSLGQLVSNCSLSSAGGDIALFGNATLITNGTSITTIDRSNILFPTILNTVSLPDAPWNLIIKDNRYVFAIPNNKKIVYVLDYLDRNNPVIIKSFVTDSNMCEAALNGEYLLLASCSEAKRAIYSVQDPSNPQFLETLDTVLTSNLKTRGVASQGDLAFFGCVDTDLSIVNLFRWKLEGNPTSTNGGTCFMKLKASLFDGTGLEVPFKVQVVVPPVVKNPMPPRLEAVGEYTSFSIDQNVFFQPNGYAMTFTANTPSWLNLNSYSGLFSGKPSGQDTGTFIIQVFAHDEKGGVASTTFPLVIDNFPVSNFPIGKHAADVGKAFSLSLPSGVFTDIDKSPLTYEAKLSDGNPLPSFLSINTNSGTIQGIPQSSDAGKYSIEIRAKDPEGGSATSTFALVVKKFPEVKTSVSPLGIGLNEYFSYTIPEVVATIDGQTLTWSVTKGDGSPVDSWLIFDRTTRTISGTPPEIAKGNHLFLLHVIDSDEAVVSVPFTITVATPIPRQKAVIGKEYQYTIDPKIFGSTNGTYTYSITNINGGPVPSWITFLATNGSLSGTPKATDIGTITLAITANSILANSPPVSYTANINVQVRENVAPAVMNFLSNQQATTTQEFSYVIPRDTFGDGDGDPLTLSVVARDNNAPWMQFGPATWTVFGIPGRQDTDFWSERKVVLEVRATDGMAFTSTTLNLSVGGESELGLFLKIASPIFTFLSGCLTVYKLRARIWNCMCHARYRTPLASLEQGNIVLKSKKDNIETVQMLEGKKKLINGEKLPPWLVYNPRNNELVYLKSNDIELGSEAAKELKIQVINSRGRILEEFPLEKPKPSLPREATMDSSQNTMKLSEIPLKTDAISLTGLGSLNQIDQIPSLETSSELRKDGKSLMAGRKPPQIVTTVPNLRMNQLKRPSEIVVKKYVSSKPRLVKGSTFPLF